MKKEKTSIPFRIRKRVSDAVKVLKLADKKVKNMGDLIDLPMDVFKDYTEAHFNLGQTKMLKDQFRMTYENVAVRKEGLIKKHAESSDAMEKARIEDTIKRIYLVLQRLEDRIAYLEEREKSLLRSEEMDN